MPDESVIMTPGFFGQYSNAYFDFMKSWTESTNKRNLSPTDWRIWLPRAFYLNWSDPKTSQKSMADPTIWLPMAYYPQDEIERVMKVFNVARDLVMGDKANRDIYKELKDVEIKQIKNVEK
jgi:hypothetical protein